MSIFNAPCDHQAVATRIEHQTHQSPNAIDQHNRVRDSEAQDSALVYLYQQIVPYMDIPARFVIDFELNAQSLDRVSSLLFLLSANKTSIFKDFLPRSVIFSE